VFKQDFATVQKLKSGLFVIKRSNSCLPRVAPVSINIKPVSARNILRSITLLPKTNFLKFNLLF